MGKERTAEGRIGSNVDPILYRKLCKIARLLGRTKSDLLKEGIWELIQQKKQKQKGGGGMLYILNSLIVPVDFQNKQGYVVSLWKIDLETARKIVREMPFTSAVGHEATAKVLTDLLGVEIPHNRIAVKMKDGDSAIHFVLRTRLPEGKVLTEEELRELDFDLVLSRVS
jgi:hypothetical protein